MLTWEKIKPGQYRTADGRFTISRVNLGRCHGITWVLVDNQTKSEAQGVTLRDAKDLAETRLEPRRRTFKGYRCNTHYDMDKAT